MLFTKHDFESRDQQKPLKHGGTEVAEENRLPGIVTFEISPDPRLSM